MSSNSLYRNRYRRQQATDSSNHYGLKSALKTNQSVSPQSILQPQIRILRTPNEVTKPIN